MLIREFAMDKPGNDKDAETLAAVSTLLAGRAEDESARKQMSIDAFIELARQQGINVTEQNLGELISKEPLKNIIANIEGNDIIFHGEDGEQVGNTMTVDQARQTVDSMAKRALNR